MVEKSEKTPIDTLKLSNERVEMEIDPQGAFLKSLEIDGKEIIYQPRDNKPGRGGIPILGPTPGPVKDNRWEYLYPNMPSHGADRKVLWSISKQKDNEIVLKRTIGPKEFLFAGEVEIKLKILEDGASISKVITNHEEKPREIGHGFHPYFPINPNTTFSPDIINNLHPITPGKSEIVKPGVSIIEMRMDKEQYSMTASPNPTQTVVWSDNPELYECIEPWWAEGGRGDTIKPNEKKTYSLEIRKVTPRSSS